MNPLIAYLAAVLGTLAIGAGSIVALEIGRPDGYNVETLTKILTMCGTVLVVLLGILKTISSAKVIEEVKEIVAKPPVKE